jgi:hypothetical protein
MDWRIGVTNLLSPDDCTLLLIDHQGSSRTDGADNGHSSRGRLRKGRRPRVRLRPVVSFQGAISSGE